MTTLLLLLGALVVAVVASASPISPPPLAAGGKGFRGVLFVASPNKSSRNRATIDTILVHYTAGSTGSVKWLCNPDAKASAHFVIDRAGVITQLVDLSESAWHAGLAEMPDGTRRDVINAYSIGIELENWGKSETRKPGMVEDTLTFRNGVKVKAFWEPYPEPQISALAWLVAELKKDHPIKHLLGHQDVARPMGDRKFDPGPLFPWPRIRAESIV